MKEERFKNWKKIKIEEGKLTKFHWLVQHVKNLKLGHKTDIGVFVYLNAKSGIIIEDHVQIGGGTKVYSIDTMGDRRGKIVLKKNCKIGANSVILPKVTIGANSVIGACSVVKHGTTKLISPFNTLINCGSSSIPNFRRNFPTLVILSSPEDTVYFSPFSIAPFSIVLNLNGLNNCPFFPTLSCRKKNGPGESSLMQTATIKNKGESKIKAIMLPQKSICLLMSILNLILPLFSLQSISRTLSLF